jgi:hypothetical protein
MPIKCLFSACASDNLADLLHIPADAGDGVAAADHEGDEGEGDDFLHAVPDIFNSNRYFEAGNSGVRALLKAKPGSDPCDNPCG